MAASRRSILKWMGLAPIVAPVVAEAAVRPESVYGASSSPRLTMGDLAQMSDKTFDGYVGVYRGVAIREVAGINQMDDYDRRVWIDWAKNARLVN